MSNFWCNYLPSLNINDYRAYIDLFWFIGLVAAGEIGLGWLQLTVLSIQLTSETLSENVTSCFEASNGSFVCLLISLLSFQAAVLWQEENILQITISCFLISSLFWGAEFSFYEYVYMSKENSGEIWLNCSLLLTQNRNS